MENHLKVLFLYDSIEDVQKIQGILEDHGLHFKSTIVTNKEEYIAILDDSEFDVILSDHSLEDFNTEEALNIRNNKKLLTSFLLITEHISNHVAISIIQGGASDFLIKDRLHLLPSAITQVITRKRLLEDKLKIEQDLFKSNERFELAAKATSEAIWDWDLQENKMVYGEGFETIFGYTSSECQASSNLWLKHIHPDDKTRVTNSLEEFINKSSDHKWSEEYRYIRKDGSFATVINKGIVLRENSIPFRLVGSIQDITQLSERNNELKQFSYIVSHNLNAPLSNLLGILKLVNYSNLDEHNLSLLKLMAETTKQLKQIVEHLSYTLIIKNTPVEFEEVSLQQTLDKCMLTLQLQILELHPIIHAQFDVPIIKTKPTYLDSIFLNLLSNALKYRSPTRLLQITIKSEPYINGRTLITFSDSGLGIDLNRNKNKVFGLYQRFHDVAEGQGMGLFLIKTQISAMGGSIEIESQVDMGTTFKIVL